MKRVITNGITDLEPLAGSSEWYWGADYASGNLYEEELFRSGHPSTKIDEEHFVLEVYPIRLPCEEPESEVIQR